MTGIQGESRAILEQFPSTQYMPTVVTLPYEGFVIVFSVRTCKSKTWFMYTQTYIFLKVSAPVFILQKMSKL